MDRVSNPYSPNAGAPPPALVGRSELLDSFSIAVQRIRRGRAEKSMFPTGLRGVGKTVLLNRFVEQARDHGYLIAQIEASEDSKFIGTLGAQLRPILFELDRNAKAAALVKRALRVFKSFSASIGLDGLTLSLGVDAEPGVADSGDLSTDLSALLVSIGEAAATEETAVLIAVDEVQYLSEAELGSLIMAVHRITQLTLPIMLVGTGLPQLPALAGNAKSYAERLFNYPTIGPLSVDDAKEAIAAPARELGVDFSEGALVRLFEITRGYPYFIQEWAYHIWNHASTSPIAIDDVKAVEDRVLRALDESFFRVRYDRLTPRERRYLRAMAELGEGPHRSGDIAGVLGTKVESLSPLRSGLIAKGMIYSPQHGDTAFTVPLFDAFMRRAMQL
jgi:hypothetical protein